MPASLIVGQAAPRESLELSIQVDGILTDAAEVSFTVYNEDSLPGSSVLTGTVTTGAGHFATGRYSVYNVALAALWTPATAIGRGRVEWLYRLEAGGTQYRVDRSFEVLANTVASRYQPVYATQAEINDLGTLALTARKMRDVQVEWTGIIDRYCRQRFRLNAETRVLRGSGSRLIHFGEPLWGLSSAKRNAGTTDDTLTDYNVFGARHEDRFNSKIVFASTSQSTIFTSIDRRLNDFAGGLNQTFTGLWGFVDLETLEAPTEVRHAAAIGIFLTAQNFEGLGPVSNSPGGPIAKEETDQHSTSYAVSSGKSRGGMMAILKNPAVRDALDLYRAPMFIASPAQQYR
jgi:hypothetical protein